MARKTLNFVVQSDKFVQLRQSLAQQGVTLTDANVGSADAGHGVTVGWNYVAPMLEITIDAGWLTMGIATDKVTDAIKPFVG